MATYSEIKADALSGWRAPILPAHIAAADADLFNGEFARHPIGCGHGRVLWTIPGRLASTGSAASPTVSGRMAHYELRRDASSGLHKIVVDD